MVNAAGVILHRVNDAKARELVEAWNAIKGANIADHYMAAAQIMSQLLQSADQDLRAALGRLS